GGAVHDELEELLARRSPRQVPGQRRPLVGRDEPAKNLWDLLRRNGKRDGHRARQPRLEALLERAPEAEQRGLPLPRGVNAREAPVVQLVAGIEGEMEVVVRERLAGGLGHRWQRGGRSNEVPEQFLGERPPGGRQPRTRVGEDLRAVLDLPPPSHVRPTLLEWPCYALQQRRDTQP